MRFLLHQWHKPNPLVVEFQSDEALNDALAEFASLVGTRFLRRTAIARYDEDEYEFGELHRPEDMVWEMDSIISMYFLDALRTFEPTLPAHAHRLIALIARLRSQQKKVQMRSPIGSRASEEGSRDIQCYVNLLASILFEEGKSRSLEGKPLRLAEAEFFAIDDKFNPARALRFAVFCLLKEDIDHDHRLTMIFDEDALRLDLFLLLFHELGRVYTPEVESLELPRTLPDHLTSGIFKPAEILDLMSTIALSAYHAQRSTIVDDIVDMAADFARQHRIAWSSIQLSRLWCCKIDASLRRGAWRAVAVEEDDSDPEGNGRFAFVERQRSAEVQPGHLGTLAFVRGCRRAWYPDLADEAPSKAIVASELSRHKAHLRLLIREADLCMLVHSDRSAAAKLYGLVEDIETALSQLPEQHDPVVLSGRAGRRYIQFLLRDPAVLYPSDKTRVQAQQIFAKVEALLSVNKSRLRRFSGADRVGVMLDMARLKLMRGDYAGANDFAESAKRRAFSGSVSHGGKLDVFQVLARVKLDLVENGDPTLFPPGEDEPEILKDAATAIRNLEAIARHLNYAPSLGMANMLKARLELALDKRQRQGDGVKTEENLNAAREAIAGASKTFAAIGQVNLDESLMKMDAEIRARRKAAYPS